MPRTALFPSTLAITLGIALITALGLAGCGRKGALEAPPDQALITGPDGKPVSDRKPVKPDKPFVLDGLLN